MQQNLPEVTDFLRGKSRNVVTLLLSKFKSTEGKGGGGAGVSEWERSCMERGGGIMEALVVEKKNMKRN